MIDITNILSFSIKNPIFIETSLSFPNRFLMKRLYPVYNLFQCSLIALFILLLSKNDKNVVILNIFLELYRINCFVSLEIKQKFISRNSLKERKQVS